MRHNETDFFGWSFLFGGWGQLLLGLIILIIVAYLLITIFRGSSRQGNRNETSTRALDILNERFAKGEITETEYEKKRAMIEQK